MTDAWQNRIVGYSEELVEDLLANPLNYRTHPKHQQDALRGVLSEVGIVQNIIVNDRTGHLVDGHLRVQLAYQGNQPTVPVTHVDLSEDEEREILATLDPISALATTDAAKLDELLRDVQSGEADVQAMLAELAEKNGLLTFESTNEQPTEDDEEAARQTLAERFLVPPFSVLDARQGYWQERKRAWLALGIQSELGRGQDADGLLGFSEEARSHYASGPARTFGQDLMRGEHVVGAGHAIPDGGTGKNSAWLFRHADGYHDLKECPQAVGRGEGSPPDGDYAYPTDVLQAQSGTSIFDPVLCELAYSWFSPPEGTVLDPFAGGSVRGIVAARLGRAYIGIDLSARQISANEQQARDIVPDRLPRWIVGDSQAAATLAPGAYDFLFSCPPYADLEVYSDDPRDLSTMEYDAFLSAYRAIIAASASMLRTDRFACFVVGDIRDKHGLYRNFVADTTAAFAAAGMSLYNEAILVTAVGSLPIRVGKQFSAGRKLGKTHQNVLVFVKGDPKRATEACGPVDIVELDEVAS